MEDSEREKERKIVSGAAQRECQHRGSGERRERESDCVKNPSSSLPWRRMKWSPFVIRTPDEIRAGRRRRREAEAPTFFQG